MKLPAERITGLEFGFILLSVLYFVTFIGFAITVDELRRQASRDKEVASAIDKSNKQRISTNEEVLLKLGKNQTTLLSQTAVLEASLDSQEMRWTRIKKVRNAISAIATIPLTVEEKTAIASAVVDSSEEFDVPASLILGIIKTESNFNSRAKSHAGAEGLMQIMPQTAVEIRQWLNKKYFNPWRPKDNIRFGSSYFARMLHVFEKDHGTPELAIKAYNCGATCVMKVESGEWKAYPTETQEYLPKVMGYRLDFINQGITW
jgi:soluble lytic murein transglycosylase-like protein